MYQTILINIKSNILLLTLNRPDKLNALNTQVLNEIKQILAEYESNSTIKGIIITGSGEKAFAAGADIAEFANFNSKQGTALAISGSQIMKTIEQYPKPIIAAVNGFALGGGCELAMACHLRIMSENASFGQPEVNLGIIPGYGGTQRLAQLIGKGKALELLMTADTVKANEALQLGWANYVVPQANLLEKCTEIIQKIANKAPLAIAHVIKCLDAQYDELQNGYAIESAAFGDCCDTQDFKEGTKAFLERRKATFEGK